MKPTTLADLRPDARNARRRGPRAEGLLVASLQEVGAARSIVIDETGRILAGNGTVQAAAEAGIERVQVVDADGETIVAVRRTGLTEAQKRRLALLDNRTAELATWDPEVLAGLAEEGLEIGDMWNENELAMVTGNLPEADDPRNHWQGMDPLDGDPRACRALTVYFPSETDVADFAELVGAKLTDRTKHLWFPAPPPD